MVLHDLRSPLSHALALPLLLEWEHLERGLGPPPNTHLDKVTYLADSSRESLQFQASLQQASVHSTQLLAHLQEDANVDVFWSGEETTPMGWTTVLGNAFASSNTLRAQLHVDALTERNHLKGTTSGSCDIVFYSDNGALSSDDSSSDGSNPANSVRETRDAVAVFKCVKGHHAKWWSAVEEAHTYLKTISDENLDVSFSKPVLLVAATYGYVVPNQQYQFHMGAFLCWQKDGTDDTGARVKKHTASLLWRTITSSRVETLRAWSNVAAVALTLEKWQNVKQSSKLFQVLGPSCCKVDYNGEPVLLRCYDTRRGTTDRKPDMYFDDGFMGVFSARTMKIRASEGLTCERVVHIQDPGPVSKLAFGDRCPTGRHLSHHFWSQRGQLLVMKVPYFDLGRIGTLRHIATSPRDFLPIVQQLKALHQRGFVHGDIRGSNILFGDNGTLIDFDLSGPLGQATYPLNYQFLLPDGCRLGVGGERIERYHDWYALVHVMFALHDFVPPTAISKAYPMLQSLSNDGAYFLSAFSSEDKLDESVQTLETHLHRYRDWTCELPKRLTETKVDSSTYFSAYSIESAEVKVPCDVWTCAPKLSYARAMGIGL